MMKGDIEMVHRCNKEIEITQIGNDVQWIRKELEGNGTPGLIRQVQANTRVRNIVLGIGLCLEFLIGLMRGLEQNIVCILFWIFLGQLMTIFLGLHIF